MSVPLAGVSMSSRPVPQIIARCFVGQKMLILRNDTDSSLGLITRNEPPDSRYGSVGCPDGPAVDGRGSVAGAAVRFGRVPEAVVEDKRGSVPGLEVRDEPGSTAERSGSIT